ncbi:MAG: PKD domain-containing protein [Thermoplasmata archaeon]|nr:PKD domain-containing protein [Thermoplasmata archaeon]
MTLPAPAAAETPSSVSIPNGSLGSVAFSWILSNDTVASGAVNQRYPLTPDRLLYVSGTGELWLAFSTPPPAEPYNTSVVNLTNGATDDLAGVGNVTAFVYDPSVGEVFLTQIPPGGGGGELLAFGVRSHELARAPTAVGPHPTDLAVASITGNLWITGSTNAPTPGSVTIVSNLTGRLSAVIPVGVDPTGLAFDPAAGLAFIANSGSANVSVLEEANGSRGGAAIPLPGPVWPGAIAFDNKTGQVVALVNEGPVPSTVLVTIDPSSRAVTTYASLPGNATASTLAIDPATGDAYVATEQVAGSPVGGGELLRWSFDSPGWTAAGFVGRNPDTQLLDPSSSQDFVGHSGQSYVSVVNVSRAAGPPKVLEFGGGPRGGAFDPTDGRVYVVNSLDGGSAGSAPDVLEAILPATGGPAEIVAAAPPGLSTLGATLAGVVDDPSSTRLFVAERSNSDATVLDAATDSFLARFALPFAPAALADDPVRGIVYFASDAGGIASYFAGNRTAAGAWNLSRPSVALNATFEALAVDPSTGTVVLLVPDLGPSGVSGAWILSPRNGSSRFVALGAAGAGALGDYPTAVAVDPLDGAAYVALAGGSVEVLNLTSASVVANATVGTGPTYLLFDAATGSMVLADGAAGALRLLNGTSPGGVATGIVTVPIGPDPMGLTFDPAVNQLVVSDYGSGTLDAFSTVPEVGSLTVHITVPTVGEEPGVTEFAEVNRPVLLDALAGGGVGPLRFSYSGLPTGCLTGNTSHLFCQPTGAGTVSPNVTVTDAAGRMATAQTLLYVDPTPNVVVSATPNPVDGVGVQVTIHATLSGIQPLEYSVDFGDGSVPDHATTVFAQNSATHVYRAAGTYSATVAIIDALGGTNSTTIQVDIGVPLAGNASVLPPPPGAPAFTVTLGAQVAGGIGPYTFSWGFADRSRNAVHTSSDNRSTLVQTFLHSGPEVVEVWVNDSANGSLLLFDNASILPLPTQSPPPNVSWLVVPPIVGAVVAVTVLVGWWVRRHRRARDPSEP